MKIELEEDCLYYTSDMYYFSYCGQVSILLIQCHNIGTYVYVSSKDESFNTFIVLEQIYYRMIDVPVGKEDI